MRCQKYLSYYGMGWSRNENLWVGVIVGLIFGTIIVMVIWTIYLNSRVNIRSEEFVVISVDIKQYDPKRYYYTIIPTDKDESSKIFHLHLNDRYFNIGDTLKLKLK